MFWVGLGLKAATFRNKTLCVEKHVGNNKNMPRHNHMWSKVTI